MKQKVFSASSVAVVASFFILQEGHAADIDLSIAPTIMHRGFDQVLIAQKQGNGAHLLFTDDGGNSWGRGASAEVVADTDIGTFDFGGLFIRNKGSKAFVSIPGNSVEGVFEVGAATGWGTPWDNGNDASIELASKIGSFEGNYEFLDTGSIGFFGGVRAIYLRDQLDAYAADDQAGEVVYSDVNMSTSNKMIGLQAGVSYEEKFTSGLSTNVKLTGGLLRNQRNKLLNIDEYGSGGGGNAAEDYHQNTSSIGRSYVGEVKAGIGYNFSNDFQAFAEYNYMYLNGLAVATDQVPDQGADLGKYADDGAVSYNGLKVGVNYRF